MADGDLVRDDDEIEEGEEEEGQEEGQEGRIRKLLSSKLAIIIAAVVLTVAVGGGTAYFMMGEKKSASPKVSDAGDAEEDEDAADDEDDEDAADDEDTVSSKPAVYFSLAPPFVVNFTGKSRARFLQVSIEGLTRDGSVKEAISTHFPQIRSSVVLLLSSKTHEELSSQEGKTALRKQVLKEIHKVLEAETGKEGIEEIFFTSFVMQ